MGARIRATFDDSGLPLGTSAAPFSFGACPTCEANSLAGTGYDALCDGHPCGASTPWLRSHAPVLAGETVGFHATLWDTGDGARDAFAVFDDWRWSTSPTTVHSVIDGPTPSAPYLAGSFVRLYDQSALCPKGAKLAYTNWTWSADTPADSFVRFHVRAAATVAALATAEEHPLVFTSPPGPMPLVGTPAVASAALGTGLGGTWIGKNLTTLGLDPSSPVVAIRSELVPSSDGQLAPTLKAWHLSAWCVTAK